jgi:hypothetical protein
VAEIDRHGEGRAERRVVVGTIGLELQARAASRGSAAQTMPEVWRTMKASFSAWRGRRDDEVALVLAVVVVGDDDDLAAPEGAMASAIRSCWRHRLSQPTWPRWRR